MKNELNNFIDNLNDIVDKVDQTLNEKRIKQKLRNMIYPKSTFHHVITFLEMENDTLNRKYDTAMYRMWLIVLVSNLITVLTVYEVLK